LHADKVFLINVVDLEKMTIINKWH